MPYYNPGIRNTSYHYRYIGTSQNGETRIVRSIIHGPFTPLTVITKAFGIEEMLNKHLTEYESMQVIAMAISKIVRLLPISSLETWLYGTSLSRSMKVNLES